MKELYIEELTEDEIRGLLDDEEFLPPDVVAILKKKLNLKDEPDDVEERLGDILRKFVAALRDSGLSDEEIIEESMLLYDITEEQAKRYI